MKFKDFNKKLKDSAKFNIINQADKINVDDFIIKKEEKHINVFIPKLLASLASVVFLLSLSFYMYFSFTTVTTLTIDINPSIEVKLNAFDRVIKVNAVNTESSEFVDQLRVRNKTVDILMDEIYTEALNSDIFNTSNAYALVGIYSEDDLREESIASIIDLNASMTTLTLLEHTNSSILFADYFESSTDRTYSNVGDLIVDYSSSEGVGDSDTPTTGSIDNSSSIIDIDSFGVYFYASQYDISQTKMYLIIDIFNNTDSLSTQADFDSLVDLDVGTLIIMYETIK